MKVERTIKKHPWELFVVERHAELSAAHTANDVAKMYHEYLEGLFKETGACYACGSVKVRSDAPKKSAESIHETEPRKCRECGTMFQPAKRKQTTCSSKCTKKGYNRRYNAKLKAKKKAANPNPISKTPKTWGETTCKSCGVKFVKRSPGHKFCKATCRAWAEVERCEAEEKNNGNSHRLGVN